MNDQIRYLEEGEMEKILPFSNISLREWYAGQALQGLMTDERMLNPPDGMTIADHLADNSFAIADAMMKRR